MESRQGYWRKSNLATSIDFPYSADEQVKEAIARAAKMSIQGVQPKLSVKLNIKRQVFEIVDTGGHYILKPQTTSFKEVPENEDLTMKLAELIGIEVPLHGLFYSRDGSLTYFIKRFDRFARNKKIPIEDFAQLSGKDRQTKYNSSMEKVASVIEEFCTFPAIENLKLFRLTLFNYLIGNELKEHTYERIYPGTDIRPVIICRTGPLFDRTIQPRTAPA